jgi:hypothetical protein
VTIRCAEEEKTAAVLEAIAAKARSLRPSPASKARHIRRDRFENERLVFSLSYSSPALPEHAPAPAPMARAAPMR